MSKPEWFQGPLPIINRKTQRVRKILHLRDFSHPRDCIREINRCGGRPLRVLPYLGIIIGEFIKKEGPYSLEGHPDVAYWEYDSRVNITDPFVGEITGEMAEGLSWGIRDLKASEVWPYTKGRGVKVAVIDTGIANDHPAVQKNYSGGVNILSQMFTPYDYNGHGTHVAGTIAGRANDLNIVGVAPRVQLYGVKAFNRKGSANLSDLLSAINWCIENRMDIINMSFGMPKVSDTLREAIRTAYQKGIVMVAAAGNQGNSGKIDYPAKFDETMGVTAVSVDGRLAAFSNTGEGVDLAAPGDKIISSWLNGTTREMSGTSMAVPHVSGTAALLLYLRPDLTPNQIRQIMVHSALPVLEKPGYGKVNSYRSVQLLARQMGRFIP